MPTIIVVFFSAPVLTDTSGNFAKAALLDSAVKLLTRVRSPNASLAPVTDTRTPAMSRRADASANTTPSVTIVNAALPVTMVTRWKAPKTIARNVLVLEEAFVCRNPTESSFVLPVPKATPDPDATSVPVRRSSLLNELLFSNVDWQLFSWPLSAFW